MKRSCFLLGIIITSLTSSLAYAQTAPAVQTANHWAHRHRNDGKQAPLEVLGAASGARLEPDELQRAFGQHFCQRLTDARGFVRLGRWKIYVEDGLPCTPV